MNNNAIVKVRKIKLKNRVRIEWSDKREKKGQLEHIVVRELCRAAHRHKRFCENINFRCSHKEENCSYEIVWWRESAYSFRIVYEINQLNFLSQSLENRNVNFRATRRKRQSRIHTTCRALLKWKFPPFSISTCEKMYAKENSHDTLAVLRMLLRVRDRCV